jgi:hypothetical protein
MISDLKIQPQQGSSKRDAVSTRCREPARMGRKMQLVIVLAAAIAIAAIGSHLLASWLKIKTVASQPFTIGKPNGRPPAFLAGSSLAAYGISWEQISTQTDTEIQTWGIAGGSPFEWQQFQEQVPEARTTFIVVSAYDLDEAMICDFRAELVPLNHTIQTLRAIHADWKYWKRALSQYPMTWLRPLFPTLGRSRGLMGKLREDVAKFIKPTAGASGTEAGPTLEFGKENVVDEYKLQRMSDWSRSKIMGKLAAMRVGFQDSHAFHGPKSLSFEKLLQYADQKGRAFIVVLPVSSSYSKEFMSTEMVHKFERALADAQQHAPCAEWLRLDQLPGSASDENFCDLVHMNVFGQKIATEAFQAWLKQSTRQPGS